MSKELATPTDLTIQLDKTIDTLRHSMDSLTRIAASEAVYGKPIKSGDTLIIPAAEVMCGMGFGLGFGTYNPADEDQTEEKLPIAEDDTIQPTGSGSGAGGGGYSYSRPVALVIASPEGVRVEPVLDRTKIFLAALTTAGFMIGMMARMLREPRY